MLNTNTVSLDAATVGLGREERDDDIKTISLQGTRLPEAELKLEMDGCFVVDHGTGADGAVSCGRVRVLGEARLSTVSPPSRRYHRTCKGIAGLSCPMCGNKPAGIPSAGTGSW